MCIAVSPFKDSCTQPSEPTSESTDPPKVSTDPPSPPKGGLRSLIMRILCGFITPLQGGRGVDRKRR